MNSTDKMFPKEANMNGKSKCSKSTKEEFNIARFCSEYLILAFALSLCVHKNLITADSFENLLYFSGVWGILFLCIVIELELQKYNLFQLLQWKLRLEVNHGIWCSILPFTLLLSLCQNTWKNCSDVHKLFIIEGFALFSAAIFLLGLIVLYFYTCSTLHKLNGNYITCQKSLQAKYLKITILILSLLTANVITYYTRFSFVICLLMSLFIQIIFHYCLLNLPRLCPQSFSLGEALILAQGIALFTAFAGFHIFYSIIEIDIGTKFHQTVSFALIPLFGCEVVIYCWMKIPLLRSNCGFYLTLLVAALFLIFPLMKKVVHENPVIWMGKFLTDNFQRVMLLVSWICLLLMAVLTTMKLSASVPVSTISIVRKCFHGFLLAVYIPGVVYDMQLLYLCSLLIFAVFLLLESIRIMKIAPFDSILCQNLEGFLDEKDQGLLIITHIYLLIGCSLPIWLNPTVSQEFQPMVMSGLLSLGIGDTAASIGGSLYGVHILPGTKKTFEGTLISIFSQFTFIIMWNMFGGSIEIPNKPDLIIIIISTAFLEAFTLQIDNIVIPLFMYTFWSFFK